MNIREIADAPVAAASLATGSWSDTRTELEEVASGIDLVSTFPEWEGTAADSRSEQLTSVSGQIRTAGEAAAQVAELLDSHCHLLTGIRDEVATTIIAAESAGMTVHDSGLVTSGAPGFHGLGTAVLGQMAAAGADPAAAAFTLVLRDAMESVTEADRAAADAITSAAGVDATCRVQENSLSPGARGAAAGSPDCIPPGVRIDGLYDPSVTPELREEMLRAADAAVAMLQEQGHDPADIGVEVITDGGNPATIIGNIDTADKVTTLVSGTGSGSLSALRGASEFAGRFTGPGQATVVWREWSPPGNLVGAMFNGRAEAAGPTLRKHQAMLRERNPDARLSIVGHSYGTRVIDEAARDDTATLDADEIHLLGSPGMKADSTSDLNLRALDGDAEVHVYKDSRDFIGGVADIPWIHGNDPGDWSWGADDINGRVPEDRGLWDRAMDLLGPVGDSVDARKDTLGSLWGLLDRDLGDEHSSYKTDGKVLEALRKKPDD
jgi:hypothetical protein